MDPLSEEPLDLLMACHERIHRFLGGVEALAEFPDLTDPRAVVTAKNCARYFRQALPLHAQDEDDSVTPRLRALGLGPALDDALRTMALEHDAIHAGRAALLDALDAVVEGAPGPGALERIIGPYGALLRGHLDQEERLIFVHLQRLSTVERQAIVQEIRARRTGGGAYSGLATGGANPG